MARSSHASWGSLSTPTRRPASTKTCLPNYEVMVHRFIYGLGRARGSAAEDDGQL